MKSSDMAGCSLQAERAQQQEESTQRALTTEIDFDASGRMVSRYGQAETVENVELERWTVMVRQA